MVKLYDLALEWERAFAKLDAADGVVDGELEAELDAVVANFGDKVEACAMKLRMLEAEAEYVKSEELRLAARRKAIEASAVRLKAYTLECLRIAGEPKVKGKLFTVSIAKNPASVKLSCAAEDCPFEFTRTTTTVEVDKAAIKAALTAGAELSWASLEQTESLRIR